MKLFMLVLLLGFFWALPWTDPLFGQSTNAPNSTNGIVQPSAISTNEPPEKFDALVRADFFEGLAGDREAFSRAMKLCEETLTNHTKHAQAMVWHGSGLLFLAAQAFAAGDAQKGSEFWQQGMKEMDGAVALEPDNVAVLIPRGATLLGVSKHTPDPAQGRTLLKIGVADYEKVLRLQKSYFKDLSLHARGELLFGLADGWHRLQNPKRARLYFQRVVEECEGSPYAQQAQVWLDSKDPGALPDSAATSACIGCHKR
jgi:hypothetical protein